MALLFLSGCLSDRQMVRIEYPSMTVNGKPTSMMLDTGSELTALFTTGAARLGLKSEPLADVNLNDAADKIALSEPLNLTLDGAPLTVRLPVIALPRFGPGLVAADSDDGTIGWPAIRENLLVFDADRRTVFGLPALPPATAGWLKMPVNPGDALVLESPLPANGPGLILVDTGSPFGVSLPAAQWKIWRAAHAKAPSVRVTMANPGVAAQDKEEVWADEVTIGSLTLTDVPVHEATPTEELGIQNYAGTIGMYALSRLDLMIDGKNGVAYLKPRPAPGPPYPPFNRPGAAPQTAAGNWTVASSVRLNPKPMLATSYFYLGLIDESQDNPAGALAALTRVLELEPSNPMIYVERGMVRRSHGDYSGAIDDCNHAIDLDPTDLDAYRCRSAAKSALGDFSGATADLNRILAIDPSNVDAYVNRGLVGEAKGDFDAAAADFSQAIAIGIELKQSDSDTYIERAFARQCREDFAGALEDYGIAIKAKPADASYPILYRELLLLRLHKPSADFSQTVSGWSGVWVKCVGDFLAGKMDEADLLAAAEKKDAEPVKGQRCEAYYFIGAMRSIKGDQAGAREYWGKAVATGERDFYEYQFARAELARLDSPTTDWSRSALRSVGPRTVFLGQ